MIERLNGVVEKVTFREHLAPSLDLCEIQIGFDTLYIFFDAGELSAFIGKEVLYTVRPDVIKGKVEQVVCELAELSTIQTVSSIENVKLVPSNVKRTVCNFDYKKARTGEYYPNIVSILTKVTYGSSDKAQWFDCTMLDIMSREFTVRRFVSLEAKAAVEEALNYGIGKYVNYEAKYTRYGLQTEEIDILDKPIEQSPETLVARDIITAMIQEDPALVEYCQRNDFVNNMSKVIDGEPGYVLVRMASELYMTNAIDSISTELDIRAIKRAIICSRGHLLPHKTEWSMHMLNTTKVMQVPELKTDRELMLILDVMANEEISPTKSIYIEIRNVVDNIIKVRRGINNEENSSIISDIRPKFGSLF